MTRGTVLRCIVRMIYMNTRTHAAYMPVFKLLRGNFEVFAPWGDMLHHRSEVWCRGVAKVGSYAPNLSPIGTGVGCEHTKQKIFTKFRNMNAPHRRISCTIFTKFFIVCGQFFLSNHFEVRSARQVSELQGFKVGGYVFSQIFSAA